VPNAPFAKARERRVDEQRRVLQRHFEDAPFAGARFSVRLMSQDDTARTEIHRVTRNAG
jgi:hypothetical protein